MIFGAFLCFAAFAILDKESSWCCIYSIVGIIVFVYGLSKELKRNRLLISSGVFVAILCGFMLMDYVGVITSHRPPIYVYMIKTSNRQPTTTHSIMFIESIRTHLMSIIL